MRDESKSRRQFLQGAAGLLGTGWLASHSGGLFAAAEHASKAIESQSGYSHLSPAEGRTLSALADQVFPPDETPGAAQLGAVHFIDAAMGGFMAGLFPLIRNGCEDLDKRAATGHSNPGDAGRKFHQLDFDEQTAVVRQIEDGDFFGNVHFMTLCGLFALPTYGGNHNGEAWKLIGFEPRHVWHPPFGYYDAKYAEEADHAGS